VGVGVGVGLTVGVGVGLTVGDGDGLGGSDELASGVGVLVGDGLALADGVALADADALADALALGVAVGDAPGRCVLTRAAKMADTRCPLRAAVVAAGRLEHVVVALRRSTRYACVMAALAEPLPMTNIPARMPKVAIWARRKITDTLSLRCRPARVYQRSPP